MKSNLQQSSSPRVGLQRCRNLDRTDWIGFGRGREVKKPIVGGIRVRGKTAAEDIFLQKELQKEKGQEEGHFWPKQFWRREKGRRNTFSILKQSISQTDKTIWMHCASLGEYEQGLPVFEEIRKFK